MRVICSGISFKLEASSVTPEDQLSLLQALRMGSARMLLFGLS